MVTVAGLARGCSRPAWLLWVFRFIYKLQALARKILRATPCDQGSKGKAGSDLGLT